MQVENECSKIIWDALREIMKDEGENISFLEIPEGYLFTPTSIRWKNFFLNNLFWGYSGRTQEEIKMIVLSSS